MRKRYLILLIGFVLSAGLKSLWAADAVSLSLSQAVGLAGERELGALLAGERVYEAIALKHQAYAAFTPQISAEVSQKRRTDNLDAMGIELPDRTAGSVTGPFNSFDARIRLSQMLLDAASIERLLTVRDGEKLSKAQLRKAKEDAKALVAGFYLEALRAGEKQALLRAKLLYDEKKLRVTHRAHRQARALTVDIKAAKADWKEDRALLYAARLEEKERLADLKSALGIAPAETVVLDRAATFKDFRIPSDEEMKKLIEDHPDLDAARKLVKERQSEVRIQWAEYLPKFSLVADYGLSGKQPSDSTDTYMFGIEGSMPVFDGGGRLFKKDEFEGRARESRFVLDDTERRLQSKAEIAAKTVTQAMLFMQAKDAQFLASEERLKIVQTRFLHGLTSDLELAEALYSHAAQADGRSRSVTEYLLARVGFAHAVGKTDDLMIKDRTR